MISKRILDGEDPASLKPLQDQMTDVQQKHAMSIMNSLKGAASTKDISDIMSLSDQTSRDIVGQIFQGMRQGREIEEVKKPEMGLRAGELGVSKAKQDLAEKAFAAEGGLTGQKLTDVENAWLGMVKDAEDYLIGQGITVDTYSLNRSAALKSPNPLTDPKVQGSALIMLGELRTKIIKHQPFTDDDISFLQRSKSSAQINEEGLPSAVSGYKFPSELEAGMVGGAKGEVISGQAAAKRPADLDAVDIHGSTQYSRMTSRRVMADDGSFAGTGTITRKSAYKKTATNASTGQVIGSDDGINWYDIRTGQVVK
jgi:hypothetical protein